MTIGFYIFFFACLVIVAGLAADQDPDSKAIADFLFLIAAGLFVVAALFGLADWIS